MAIRWSS